MKATVSDLYGQFPITCSACGAKEGGRYMRQTQEEMLARCLCFKCNFWQEKVEWRNAGDPNAIVTDDFRHYYVGSETDRHRGFAGHRWTVSFFDGREVVTTNLWHQGKVPEHFRDRLTPNATLEG